MLAVSLRDVYAPLGTAVVACPMWPIQMLRMHLLPPAPCAHTLLRCARARPWYLSTHSPGNPGPSTHKPQGTHQQQELSRTTTRASGAVPRSVPLP